MTILVVVNVAEAAHLKVFEAVPGLDREPSASNDCSVNTDFRRPSSMAIIFKVYEAVPGLGEDKDLSGPVDLLMNPEYRSSNAASRKTYEVKSGLSQAPENEGYFYPEEQEVLSTNPAASFKVYSAVPDSRPDLKTYDTVYPEDDTIDTIPDAALKTYNSVPDLWSHAEVTVPVYPRYSQEPSAPFKVHEAVPGLAPESTVEDDVNPKVSNILLFKRML